MNRRLSWMSKLAIAGLSGCAATTERGLPREVENPLPATVCETRSIENQMWVLQDVDGGCVVLNFGNTYRWTETVESNGPGIETLAWIPVPCATTLDASAADRGEVAYAVRGWLRTYVVEGRLFLDASLDAEFRVSGPRTLRVEALGMTDLALRVSCAF